MTFDQWWDSGTRIPDPETYRGWEASCREAWNAGASASADELARLRAELDAMARRAERAEGYAQPYHDEAARLRAELDAMRGEPHADRCAQSRRLTIALDSMRQERDRLRAELAEWHKLRDPANLHANLLRGFPAQLSRATYLHLAGDALAQEPPA